MAEASSGGGSGAAAGPHDDPPRRSFTMAVDVTTIRGQLKRADAGKFSFFSDEPPRLGGEDAYPAPLTYLAAATGF
ncbi:MAG TPA: hypothetical protein VKV26_06005 [Dehalococcoidia bacterium]|nr:hypothetical protein [Dehalococcoidia bacterium]